MVRAGGLWVVARSSEASQLIIAFIIQPSETAIMSARWYLIFVLLNHGARLYQNIYLPTVMDPQKCEKKKNKKKQGREKIEEERGKDERRKWRKDEKEERKRKRSQNRARQANFNIGGLRLLYSFDDRERPTQKEPHDREARLFPDSHFLFFQEGIGSLKVVPGGVELRGQAAVLDALVASSLRSRRGKNLVLESWSNFTASARSHDGRLLARFTVGKNIVDKIFC